ncbi:MAG: hypothetical protein IKR27_01245 [Lachnospiraceae bacterium]|nr:hypothetical protein [Lachnospiraceae bacterium]
MSTKNLYSVNIIPQGDKDVSAIIEMLEEMDEISKRSYDNKFKSIDGAISEADDVASLLDKNFPFFDNAVMTTEVAYILAIMYDCLFKVCDVLEKDKKDSLIKQYPPEQIPYGSIKELRNTISIRHASPSTFIKEDIMQLLNYIKYVVKDCKSNITFDDCITINTLIGLSKRDLEKITTSKHDRKMVLGKHYILDISDDKVEDDRPDPVEEVKEAEPEIKTEVKEEPKPEVKEEPAKSEFVFERKAPEPVFSEPVKEAEPVKEEPKAEAPKPEVSKAPKFDFSSLSNDNSYLEKLANIIPEISAGVTELDKTMATIDDIRATLNINIPDKNISDASRNIVDDIMKSINSTINERLKPLTDKANADYSELEKKYNIFQAEADKLKNYMETAKQKLTF